MNATNGERGTPPLPPEGHGPKPIEQLDHKAEALKWVNAADREASTLCLSAAQAFASVAQVHASLAIAQGQERVAAELAGLRKRIDSVTGVPADASFGNGQRFVRVRK